MTSSRRFFRFAAIRVERLALFFSSLAEVLLLLYFLDLRESFLSRASFFPPYATIHMCWNEWACPCRGDSPGIFLRAVYFRAPSESRMPSQSYSQQQPPTKPKTTTNDSKNENNTLAGISRTSLLTLDPGFCLATHSHAVGGGMHACLQHCGGRLCRRGRR